MEALIRTHIIIIAHRLSTIRRADSIIVHRGSCIAGWAQHADLLRNACHFTAVYAAIKFEKEQHMVWQSEGYAVQINSRHVPLPSCLPYRSKKNHG